MLNNKIYKISKTDFKSLVFARDLSFHKNPASAENQNSSSFELRSTPFIVSKISIMGGRTEEVKLFKINFFNQLEGKYVLKCFNKSKFSPLLLKGIVPLYS